MKKLLFLIALALLAVAAVCAASCGATSPCQDLAYKICDCEYPAGKDRNNCYADADKTTFTAAQDTECSKYKDTCNCDNYKGADADKNCGTGGSG